MKNESEINKTISILNEINLKNAQNTLKLIEKEKEKDPFFMPIVIGSTILATLATVKVFGGL